MAALARDGNVSEPRQQLQRVRRQLVDDQLLHGVMRRPNSPTRCAAPPRGVTIGHQDIGRPRPTPCETSVLECGLPARRAEASAMPSRLSCLGDKPATLGASAPRVHCMFRHPLLTAHALAFAARRGIGTGAVAPCPSCPRHRPRQPILDARRESPGEGNLPRRFQSGLRTRCPRRPRSSPRATATSEGMRTTSYRGQCRSSPRSAGQQ